MPSQKNGTSSTGDDMLAKALKEIRRKAQTDGVKKPTDSANGEEQATEFEKDSKPTADETEEPEVVAIMEKIKPAPGYDKKRNYSEIVIGADSFLLGLDKKTKQYLDVKPSCLDGLTPEEEEDLRFLGAELIETMVYLLKLPVIVGETACIFFQRFYGVQSFVKFPMEHFVMASVLLATKVEETLRSPREIITVFDHLKKLYTRRTDKSVKADVLKIDGQYVMMKNNVVVAERRLLLNLGFVCQIKHPHGYIYVYLKTLFLENNMRIFNTAWASMNDCMKTDLFLRYYPKTIAAACVVRTCRRSDPEFKLPVIDGYHWYEVYGVSSRDVDHITQVLDKLYERKHAPDWTKLISSVAEARRKKFGTETIVKLSEEEAKKAINAEEDEKKENGLSKKVKNGEETRKGIKEGDLVKGVIMEEGMTGKEVDQGIEEMIKKEEIVIMIVIVIARGIKDIGQEVDHQLNLNHKRITVTSRGSGTLARLELDPALFGFDESDVDEILKTYDSDLAYLDYLIKIENKRIDLCQLWSRHDCFFTFIDHLYLEVLEDLQKTPGFHSTSDLSSVSSADEVPYSQQSDPGYSNQNRRGRKIQYFGEEKKWANWRNNWVYGRRKQIQSDTRKAELQYLVKKNENLINTLFHLHLEFEHDRESYCMFNQTRIEAASEDRKNPNQICQCRKTGNPCPDLLSIVLPQAQ